MESTTLKKGTKLSFKRPKRYTFGKTYKSLEEFKKAMTKYHSK